MLHWTATLGNPTCCLYAVHHRLFLDGFQSTRRIALDSTIIVMLQTSKVCSSAVLPDVSISSLKTQHVLNVFSRLFVVDGLLCTCTVEAVSGS